MQRMLETETMPLVEHALEARIRACGDDREGKAAALRACEGIVGGLSDVALRQHYIVFLADRLHLRQEIVLARVNTVLRGAKRKEAEEGPESEGGEPAFPEAELTLLRLMLKSPEAVEYMKKSGVAEHFQDQDQSTARCARLMMEMMDRDGAIDPGRVLDELDDPELAADLDKELFIDGPLPPAEIDRALRECVACVVLEEIRMKKEELTRRIKKASEDGDQQLEKELFLQKNELDREWNERRKECQKSPLPANP
jgi:hypothetical protein